MTKKRRDDLIDQGLERTATLAAIVVGISVAWQTLYSVSPYLSYWAVWFIGLYVLTVAFGFPVDIRAQRARRITIVIVLVAGVVLTSTQIHDHMTRIRAVKTMAEFEKSLAICRWIAYESPCFDPYENRYPTPTEIQQELKILTKDGFNGLITFSADNSLADIPRIAKLVGFKSVIMGVTHIADVEEVASAIQAADYVDAYCIGHMFTDYPYSAEEVLKALKKVRHATHRPVTTTLRPNGYMVYPQVSTLIDFFCPDIHSNWYFIGTANHIFNSTKNFIQEVEKLQAQYPEKPILLKLISIPSAEVPGASTEEQYVFYRQVVEFVESSIDFPERVFPSYFSAYDLPWKSPKRGWPPGERFVGLYDSNRTPKTAIIDGNVVPVVSVFGWRRVVPSAED